MLNTVIENNIGKFEMKTPNARISDPCYNEDTWCAGVIGNCKTGKWNAKVIKSDEGGWGKRVAYLLAWHEDSNEPDIYSPKWDMKNIDVGVDSGQAGIFDNAYFKDDTSVDGLTRMADESICEDEPFYSMCCDRTLCEESAGVINYGCVSSSGYGDGSYHVSSIDDGHNVVAIMIDFGLDYDEDEDYDYDEDEYEDEDYDEDEN